MLILGQSMVTVRDSQLQQMGDSSPGQPLIKPCPNSKTWVEFRLVDTSNEPVAGAKYKARLPDSSTQVGVLDADGKVRFEGILPGQASICFPDLDAKTWKRI